MWKLILSLGLVAAANAGPALNNVEDAWQSLVSPLTTKGGVAPPCYWQLDEAHCRQSYDKDTCDKDDPEQGYAQAGTCNQKGYFPVCCTFVDKTTGLPVQFWYRKGLSCAYDGWQPCPTALASTSVAVAAIATTSSPNAEQCPGSKAFVHAKATIKVSFDNTCAEVQAEVQARAEGSTTGKWQDPHGGNYTTPSMDGDVWSFEHHTAHGGYTDKIMFTFSASDDGKGCNLYACSESQVTSVFDMSTNFCNSHDLYCADEGCHVIKTKLSYTEDVDASSHQKSTTDCYKK